MADFAHALAFTLRNEGSAYVNDENDKGGPSKMGVTMHTLSSWRGYPASPAEVATLTVNEAALIYKNLYWDKVGGDRIASQPLATILFDMSVLCGPPRALVTLAHARELNTQADDNLLALELCNGYAAWLSRVARNKSQAAWLPGWLRRVERCRSLVNQGF